MSALEIWKDVKGYEGLYQVSNTGRLKRVAHERADKKHMLKERIARLSVDKDGYFYVKLRKDGAKRQLFIHRLVAEAFLDNPKSLPAINHKDGIKQNNTVENLEFCTFSYNTQHAYKNGLIKHFVRKVRCIETGEIFNSLREVTEKTGISYKHIPCCCRGRRKTVGGYRWEYVESEV
jgi:hypothetical protein